MKGDVYFLRRNEDNYVNVFFIVENNDCCLIGDCYEPYSWLGDGSGLPFEYESHFLASVYCKPDACTHWNFYGEDFDKVTDDKDIDSYYHLCSCWGFNTHIRSMCFVWKLAAQLNDESLRKNGHTRDVTADYFENEITRKLVDLMLDGYRIEKASDKEAKRVRESV